jgi:hypothetical protein
MNSEGRKEGRKDGRTGQTERKDAHIKSLSRRRPEHPKTTTKITSTYLLRKKQTATFQLLIPSWSKTPSTVRFTGDNAHKTCWSQTLSLYMCIYLRWKNGEDGGRPSSSREPTQTYLAYISYFLYLVQYSRSIFFDRSTAERGS